jgi:hypothetical protein
LIGIALWLVGTDRRSKDLRQPALIQEDRLCVEIFPSNDPAPLPDTSLMNAHAFDLQAKAAEERELRVPRRYPAFNGIDGSKGSQPTGGLTFDAEGNLYGTTSGGGPP